MVELIDATKGKIRDKPVSDDTLRKMKYAAELTDPNLSIRVVSGGQEKKNPFLHKGQKQRRTGSTRHDVDHTGHSHTADIVLMRGGKAILPGQDKDLYANYFRNAAALGFEGLGHYAWGIHVGGGSRMAWGPNTKSDTVDPTFKAAMDAGWASPISYGESPADGPLFQTPTGEVQPEIKTPEGATYTAPETETRVDQVAREAAGPQPYDTFGQEFGAAYDSQTITAQLARYMSEGATDPSFTMGEQRAVDLTKQYEPTYHDFLLSADSELVLQQRMKWASEDTVRQQRLQAGGWSSTGAQFLAGAVDPVVSVPSLLTGGMGGALIKGGSMAGNIGRSALMGGVSSAAIDFGSQQVFDDPHADPLMAGAIGMGFGALGGALMRRGGSNVAADEAYRVSAQMQKNPNYVSPEIANEAPEVTLGGHGGAARNPNMRDSLIGEQRGIDIEMSDASVPKGFGGWFRKADVAGQMTTAKNPMTRLFGMHLFEETAGFTDHSVVPDSVNSRFTAAHRKFEGNFNVSYLPAKNDYIKEGGLSKLNLAGRARREQEFNRAVNHYIWDPNPSPDTNQHVVKAASAFRKGMADFAEEMQDAGLWKGGPDKHYVPLVSDHNVIAHMDQLVHQDVMEKALKQAIMNHTSDLSDVLAGKMARGYWANIRKAGFGIEDSMSKSLHLEDRDGFKKAFNEALENKELISDDELAEVFDLLSGMMDEAKKTAGDGSKGVARLKRRTLMNYNEKMTIQKRDGTMMEFRPRDLFEQDAELLFRRYTRTMTGRLAFAKTKIRNPETGDLIVDGIRSESDLDRMKQSLKESYRLAPGTRASKQSELANALENIDFAWAKINGIPIYGSEKGYAQWARRVKSMQFIRLMSNMGLNQVQETWKMVSLTGFRASLSQMPSIRSMSRAAATGKVSRDKLLRELGDMTGIGMDNLWNRYDLRLSDDRLGAETGGRVTRMLDNALDLGQQLTTQVSFMRQISDYQQRWAMKAITQQIAEMGRKAGTKVDGEWTFDYAKIKERDRQRLASIGLGEEDATKLFGNLLKHSEFDGKKIVGINTMAWDADAVSKFRVFLNRYTDRLVQQNDFGALSKWMSNPVASMFIQFRSFVFGAWAKSTLWSLNHGAFADPRMMVLLLGEIAAGAATFAVRQSGAALTDDGFEKYWEETMSPQSLLANGFARTATASVVPMFLDSLLMATPLGPQFGQARASGSATDAWTGLPAKDQLDSGLAFSRGLGRALWEGDDLTQNQIKAGVRAFVPLGNWIPFTATLNTLIEDRPR